MYANLNSLKAKRKTLIIDACFSGRSEGGDLYKDKSGIYVKAKMPAPGGILAMYSSTGKEISSWHREKMHSLFTYYLLKKIKTNAVAEKTLTVRELKDFVGKNVADEAFQQYRRAQTPQFEGDLNAKILDFK